MCECVFASGVHYVCQRLVRLAIPQPTLHPFSASIKLHPHLSALCRMLSAEKFSRLTTPAQTNTHTHEECACNDVVSNALKKQPQTRNRGISPARDLKALFVVLQVPNFCSVSAKSPAAVIMVIFAKHEVKPDRNLIPIKRALSLCGVPRVKQSDYNRIVGNGTSDPLAQISTKINVELMRLESIFCVQLVLHAQTPSFEFPSV